MLSTLPIAKTLVDKTHAARRIAARIASAFVPTGHLDSLTHEALCYGCMVGIGMPIHHDIAPWDRGHDQQEPELKATLPLCLNDTNPVEDGDWTNDATALLSSSPVRHAEKVRYDEGESHIGPQALYQHP